MKDKLTKLIIEAPKIPRVIGGQASGRTFQTAENMADHLIANGVTVQQWIPVTERKPEDGIKVLVSVSGRDEALIGWYDADWDDWVVEEELSEKKLMPVTHWQEKPKPAKER